MNKYTECHINGHNERDYIFREVLSKFNNQSISILEIGVARNLDTSARAGDGYSSLFWGEYAAKTNSKVTLVELDTQALENCKIITEDFQDYITYVNQCGIEFLKNNKDKFFDLIYLDGPDDNQITLDMFELCDQNNSYILVDDFLPNGKADLLKQKYPNYFTYQCKGCSHQIGLYFPNYLGAV